MCILYVKLNNTNILNIIYILIFGFFHTLNILYLKYIFQIDYRDTKIYN